MPTLRDIISKPELRRVYDFRKQLRRKTDSAIATDDREIPEALPAGSRLEKRAVDFNVRIVKIDAERRLLYGVVYEPLVEDTHGNWAEADEIESAAHIYLANHRGLNVMHSVPLSESEACVVESYVAAADFKLGDQVIRKGTWVLVAKIHDDEIWAAVEDGTLNGWSMEGWAEIVVDEPLPADAAVRKESQMRLSLLKGTRVSKGAEFAKLLNAKIDEVIESRGIDRESLLAELVENFPEAGDLATVTALLDGSAEPTPPQIAALAEAFEIPTEDLEAAAEKDGGGQEDKAPPPPKETPPAPEKKRATAKAAPRDEGPVPGRMKDIVIPVVAMVDAGANRKNWALKKDAARLTQLRDVFKRAGFAHARLEKALNGEGDAEKASADLDAAIAELAVARGVPVVKNDAFVTFEPGAAKEMWTRLAMAHDALLELGGGTMAISREDGTASVAQSAIRRTRAACISLLEVLPETEAAAAPADPPPTEAPAEEPVAKNDSPTAVSDWLEEDKEKKGR